MNEAVELDGTAFHECSFTNVTLRFRGTGAFGFIGDNKFENPRLEIVDQPSRAAAELLSWFFEKSVRFFEFGEREMGDGGTYR